MYQLEGLQHARRQRVRSPFGEPSDDLLLGELDGRPVAFLPRHGRGHRIPPSEINGRANIDALKRVGVTDLLSLSAVGSLREDLPPGTFVIVDQFVDRTFRREATFFERGLVAHVSLADPVCRRLGDALEDACRALGLPHRRGGTSLVIEGPQFSTRAESGLYRQWGCDVIGMTSLPEARLAREAELCYAAVGMVTDYDCWHPEHGHVTVSEVMALMHANADGAGRMVEHLAPALATHPDACPAGCDRALDTAIVTPPGMRDAGVAARLDAVAGRVLHPAPGG
ncbi:MAG: methylthioadenosine phosphorylase [Gemmatimonadetes bacterium]|nr:methylthioadenosine phosphorylase [Gemmatimonadota bacterium]